MEDQKTIDEWWDKFEAVDSVDEKINLIKDVANLNKPKEFYKDLEIGDAIFEYIEPELKDNLSAYCLFLEMLRNDYPNIFDIDGSWFIRWLIKYYVFVNKKEKVESLINYLLNNPKDDPDIIFDILDFLIINEHIDEAWKLCNFYITFFNETKSMISSGLNELSVLSSLFIVSKEKKEKIKEELKKYDYQQKDNIIEEKIKILRDERYTAKNWQVNDFQGKEGMLNFYILSLEFARDLKEKQNLVTAHYLQQVLYEYYCEVGLNRLKFNEKKTDEVLVAYAGIFSLNHAKAFIILCSLKLFYGFLRKRSIIDKEKYQIALEKIERFSKILYEIFNEEIWKYKFADKILKDNKNESKNTI